MTNKMAHFEALQCDILATSENSATQTAQYQMNAQFTNRGYQQVWAPPVSPHFAHQQDDAAIRGMASGVSLHSRYTCRPSRIPVANHVDATRIISSIVQIADWSLHCIVIYGYPSCHPNSKMLTSQLVEEAMRLEQIIMLPTILLGDFNHHPDDLPPCQVMQQLGYASTSTLYTILYGQTMPPTCRNATTHDQMLFSAQLQSCINKIEVDQNHHFHDHDPVIVTMCLPVVMPHHQAWVLPKPWLPYEPDPQEVARAFDQLAEQHQLPTDNQPWTPGSDAKPLQSWSEACECAVDKAIQTQHRSDPDRFPQAHLPKSCKGRGIARKLLTKPQRRPVRQACDGQYTPPLECISYKLLHWTKQTRRVQSYRNLMRKFAQGQVPCSQLQMQQEWWAISKASGFGYFPKWCAFQPELACFPFDQPTLDYVETLAQLLQHHTEAKAVAEQKRRDTNSRFRKHYDQHRNHMKQTISQIKGNAQPPLDLVRSTIQAEATDITVTHIRVARELGYTVHYNKQHSRATQRARHLQALDYIKKARQSQLTLDNRARLCYYAVIKALWGTESYVVGQSWFNALRSAIAKTLIIDKHHSNSHLACMLLSKFVLDPELYHIQQCIRTNRNMLIDQPAEVQFAFFAAVSQHSTRHQHVWGPAGTLAYALGKLSWQMSSDGTVHTDTLLQLHLLHSSQEDLLFHLEQAWLRHMVQCHLPRPEWAQLPTPDRASTLHCIRQLPDDHHKVVSMAITGTSMLASQIKHFGDGDDTCALCGQIDSYTHRALECSATSDVRERWHDLVETYDELNKCHVDLPVVYQHPEDSFHQWFFHQRPCPDPTSETVRQIEQIVAEHGIVEFYTDGSCSNPTLPSCRRAAFAVILAHPCLPAEQQEYINRFAATGKVPDAFQVCMVAETRGKQSIPRAELQAAQAVAMLSCPACFWTDSQYVVDIIHLLQTATSLEALHKRKNYDILRELWHHVRRPDFQVRKVKAHSLNIAHDTRIDSWHKLGNHAADLAAKHFLDHLQRNHPLQLDSVGLLADKQRCLQWYRYLHDLQIERAKLFQQDVPGSPTGTRLAPWQQQFDMLKTWTPASSWHFDNLSDYQEHLGTCVWGSQYADLILQWFSHVHWPTNPEDYDPHGLGVTWNELTLSFVISTQHGVVVNSGGQHADFRPTLVPPNMPGVAWTLQVSSFERAVRNVQSKVSAAMFPDVRALAKSYKILGGEHAKHGLAARPQFPFQSQVADLLAAHIADTRNRPAEILVPHIPIETPICNAKTYDQDREDTERGWQYRVYRARQRRVECRNG
eukprot:Skav221408  [mRNA]  locus=scaffold1621:155055:160175:+ [translate_table: standard]